MRPAALRGDFGFRFLCMQHAFARVNGVHYDARAATIANGRTTELLAEILE